MTTRPPDPAIAVRGLAKTLGNRAVLDGIDLTVPTGSVFALLGPNGAGKTTTVRILTTLARPDAGIAQVAGHDVVTQPAAVRAAIGVTGQNTAVDPVLTGRENLRLMADLQHLGRAESVRRAGELLDRFGLADAADRRVRTYSGGMRRRLDLAMSLVGEPRVVFLDEPTTGLDPRSRRELWQIVRELVGNGVTVFLTTQYLEEADQLADRIAVLDGGWIVAEGTPEQLKALVPTGHVELRFDSAPALAMARAALPEVVADVDTLTLRAPSTGSVASVRDLLDRLDDVPVAGLAVHSPDLDDVFLALTDRRPAAVAS